MWLKASRPLSLHTSKQLQKAPMLPRGGKELDAGIDDL